MQSSHEWWQVWQARSCLHASHMCLWSISFGMSRPRVPVSQWRFTVSVVIHTLERREVCRDECKTYGADTHFILCMLMWSIGMWCARMTGFVDFWSTSWVVHSTFTVIINMLSLTCLFERSDVICVPCASACACACASTHKFEGFLSKRVGCQDTGRRDHNFYGSLRVNPISIKISALYDYKTKSNVSCDIRRVRLFQLPVCVINRKKPWPPEANDTGVTREGCVFGVYRKSHVERVFLLTYIWRR